ncbi:MAG: hypothetical protein AB7H96_23160 [Vicinamibacterales bacterium]
MAVITLDKKKLPFLLDGAARCLVDTADLAPTTALQEIQAPVFDVRFSGDTPDGATIGGSATAKVSVSTRAVCTLTGILPGSAPAVSARLGTFGLADVFKSQGAPAAILCFECQEQADTSATQPFTYGFLGASTRLEAGASARLAYAAAVDPTRPLALVLPSFFSRLRLPGQVADPPAPGEAYFLEYGGYLRLGAEASAGYRLSGTRSLSLGQIALSEQYGLSIAGRLRMAANVAGQFSVLVTRGDRDGWARVQVHRRRTHELKVAADVHADIRNDLELPSSGREFLGALLGVNGKSYIALFGRALDLSDFETFQKAVDGLAAKYIEAVVGLSFDKLQEKKAFRALLGTASRVVDSYNTVEDRAVTLFDRYFDRLGQIVPFLERVEQLTASGVDTLRKELTPELWTVLAQLTDGDPLGFLSGRVVEDGRTVDSLPALSRRARQVLDLVSADAHAELRRVIGVARARFGLDALIGELAKIDTVDELKARSNDIVGQFVRRLVGRSLGSSADLKEAFAEVRAVLQHVDGFQEKLFAAFKEATNSSYTVALHAEYSRASESDALVDVFINVGHPRGPALLAQAAHGDFEQVLTLGQPDLVQLRDGRLTHRTTRSRAFNVNVLGWHLDYQYEGMDRVVTEASQRLVPSEQGITVYTTLSLEVDRVRKRRREQEQIHVNFLFQALGQSRGLVTADARTGQYVVEAIDAFTARYQLAFTDADTSQAELEDYLAFARDTGLDTQGATLADLLPLLPRAGDGSFGTVDAMYDIRFTPDSLLALKELGALTPAAERRVRHRMRLMLLANYLRSPELHDVAFAYATPGVFALFRAEGAAKFPGHFQRTFRVAVPAGIAAPETVTLDREELERLAGLYNIEQAYIGATRRLLETLAPGARKKPRDFEKVLGAFGSAMKDFDDFDQTTSRGGIGTSTVFLLFHELVRLADPKGERYAAVLRFTSHVGAAPVEKLFMSAGAMDGRR